MPLIWRIGAATVKGNLSTQIVGESNQTLFKVKLLCWLELSAGASALRRSAEEAPTDTAVCGEERGQDAHGLGTASA